MATGAVIAGVVAIAGTAVQMSAQRKQAQAQAAAARTKADLKRMQALEVLDRFELNAEALRREGKEFAAEQFSRGSSSGSGEGSLLSMLEDTNRKIQRQFRIEERESEYKAAQLRAGADLDTRLAGDIESAGRAQRTATFLQGAGQAASIATRK
jgi:hypothetical protein